MPIPAKINPVGKSGKSTYLELTVKPGILASGMTYGFTPYWGQWDDVKDCYIDWGDGTVQTTAVNNQITEHTYSASGTYQIKLKSDCSRIYFNKKGTAVLYDCNGLFECAGNLISCYFENCSKAIFTMKKLPEAVSDGSSMFSNCSSAILPLTSLPGSMTTAWAMFSNCPAAQLPLTALPDTLYEATNMFSGCSAAELPLVKLPDSLGYAQGMFQNCTKAQISLTRIPDGLKNGLNMFLNCKKTVIDLSILAANAPEEGWTNLKNITNMFYGCPKVTGSRAAFLAKCPAGVTGSDTAFTGTATTE